MPIKTTADPKERARVEQALGRLRANEPRLPRHRERARRGSLQTNLNTLSAEAGVKRHRIEKLYPDLAAEANSDRGEKGTSVPLRKQLDDARLAKQEAERKLEQSNGINLHLMEKIAQLRADVQLLKDRVADLETGIDDDPNGLFIGTDDVIGIPAMPTRKRSRGRASRASV
ncbi:hypothetical protein [Sphingomonas sp. UYP23]